LNISEFIKCYAPGLPDCMFRAIATPNASSRARRVAVSPGCHSVMRRLRFRIVSLIHTESHEMCRAPRCSVPAVDILPAVCPHTASPSKMLYYQRRNLLAGNAIE
jgi:hypothetical protein